MNELNFTKDQRLEIYKRMLELAEADLELSTRLNLSLYGLCSLSSHAIQEPHDKVSKGKITCYLPELAPYDTGSVFWWDISANDGTNTIRIGVLKEVIAKMADRNISQSTNQ